MDQPSRRAPRPLSHAQRLENAAFLAELRRTGNAREAARRVGAHRAKFTRRRNKHPGFAAQWDAALILAQAKLAGRRSGPGTRLVRRADGRVQLRTNVPHGLDQAVRTRFLAALSACANVRLAAKAAGFSHAAFYHHKRRDPDFAREWRLALEEGYDRLQWALLEGWFATEEPADAWNDNDPPAIPPMTASQALQLLYLHQKEARFYATPEPLRRRRGESWGIYYLRLDMIREAQWQRERDKYDAAESLRRRHAEAAAAGASLPAPPILPDLAQVTGWSKASGRPAHDDSKALFGGWRLGMQERGE